MVSEEAVKDTGVSVGWFDPKYLVDDTDRFLRRIKRAMPEMPPAWPLSVSSIRNTGRGVGVAYCFVKGMIPVHIDSVGLDDSDGRIWQLVMDVRNRPALMTARADERKSFVKGAEAFFNPHELRSAAILGVAEGSHPFAMGFVELKAGMAVHFDITTHWHGVTQLPIHEDVSKVAAPLAIIMQVSGFGADQLTLAVEKAKAYLGLDRGFWDRGI